MTNKILINGKWRDGAGAAFSSFDPSTGETIWTGAAATKTDVDDAVSAARAAFEKWALTPLAERIAVMERYRDLIKRDAEDLARLISRETGKPFWETKTEAATVSGKVDISIRAYHERTGEKETATGATRGVLRHKPHGV
ncbi:aldehyde dehydrogenase family protein, partial [Hyphococcus sp.]